MTAFVVGERSGGCPVGCGVEVVLVRCLPSGRLAGWCWGCEVSLPVPLSDDHRLTDDEMDSAKYAPGGLELPAWPEVVAAGLAAVVLRSIPVAEWAGARSLRGARQAEPGAAADGGA